MNYWAYFRFLGRLTFVEMAIIFISGIPTCWIYFILASAITGDELFADSGIFVLPIIATIIFGIITTFFQVFCLPIYTGIFMLIHKKRKKPITIKTMQLLNVFGSLCLYLPIVVYFSKDNYFFGLIILGTHFIICTIGPFYTNKFYPEWFLQLSSNDRPSAYDMCLRQM